LKLFSFSVRGELVEPQKNTFAGGSSYSKMFCLPEADGFCRSDEKGQKVLFAKTSKVFGIFLLTFLVLFCKIL